MLPDQLTPYDQPAGADSDADPERRPDRVRVSSAPDGLVFALATSHYVHLPGHAHPPGAQVRVEQIAALLPPDRRDVVVAERRVHTVRAQGCQATSRSTALSYERPGPHRHKPDVPAAADIWSGRRQNPARPAGET